MNNKLLTAAWIFCLHATIHAEPLIPGLFNTGLDTTGALLALGATDPHYSWKASIPNAAWLPNTTDSLWLTPNGNGNSSHAVGIHTLDLLIDLAGYDSNVVSINGRWATDNTAEMFLNGSSTGITTPNQFLAWNEFTISGFQAGTNVIQFQVTNAASQFQNPVGLRVEFTSVVPEPSSLALLAAAGLRYANRCRRA